MKLNKSFEQAIYVLTMLALQKKHTPVKSHVLSQLLEVSDSYLKKVLMKLAKAGLVHSHSSKIGGYQLAKAVTDITLRDIFFALELETNVLDFKHIAHQVYEDKEHVLQVEQIILSTLEEGLDAFYSKLANVAISDLLFQEAYESGAIDWEHELELKDKRQDKLQ